MTGTISISRGAINEIPRFRVTPNTMHFRIECIVTIVAKFYGIRWQDMFKKGVYDFMPEFPAKVAMMHMVHEVSGAAHVHLNYTHGAFIEYITRNKPDAHYEMLKNRVNNYFTNQIK